MLPLGIPDFVVGFGWVSIDPGAARLPGRRDDHDAVAVPARLPARGQLRWATSTRAWRRPRAASAWGRWRTFWRVTLRQIWPAVLGGCLLVTLALLAEYGAFEIVQYQTFTVEIFTEFKLGFDTAAACVLSLVLVAAERRRARRRAGADRPRRASWRSGPGARRTAPRVRLGRWRSPALGGARRRWRRWRSACRSARSSTGCRAAARRTLPSASILAALGHTAAYSAAAAALATALAMPVSDARDRATATA